MALTWYVRFDWAGDGLFATNEAARVTALRVDRGRSGPFAEFAVGKCVLTLDNDDRRFDPWYTSSPLYPNVRPRCKCLIQAVAGAEWSGAAPDFRIAASSTDVLAWDGTAGDEIIYGLAWDVFLGTIEDVEPMGRVGQRTVTITLYDGMRDLREGLAPEIPLMEDQPTGIALASVLDAIGWPTGGQRYLEDGDTLTYFWTTGEQKASEIAAGLVASEQGALAVSAAGQLRFLSRATYWAANPQSSLDQAKFVDLALTSPWTLVYNQVRMRCYPAEPATSLATIWTLRDRTYVAPGASVTLAAQFSNVNGARCAASGVVTPVAYTDYTAASLPADGWNMTDFCLVSMTAHATEATLTIHNSHATVGFYMLTLTVRGYPLNQDGVTLQADDATSQATYGVRPLAIDAPWRQSVQSAIALANTLVGMYADPHPLVDVELDNVFPDMLSLDLCDQVTLTAAVYSISGTFRVGSVSLRTGATMQDLKGSLRLEPVV